MPDLTKTLRDDFANLQERVPGVIGIAFSAVGVGVGTEPVVLGDGEPGPAWSTIKVPLAIAALREENPPVITDAMTAAITHSDNAAAESIWEHLGNPVAAALKVEAVLRRAGDPTVVQSQKVRPEFTAFGQTIWALADQVRFISAEACQLEDASVLALMGHVEHDQLWGLGQIPDTEFKGGWGPSRSGRYLVRQMGIVHSAGAMTSVAIAATPGSGSFEDGTHALNTIAAWLNDHALALPSGKCSR